MKISFHGQMRGIVLTDEVDDETSPTAYRKAVQFNLEQRDLSIYPITLRGSVNERYVVDL